jgi:hypothetical protein
MRSLARRLVVALVLPVLPAAAPAQSGGHLHSDLPLLTRVAEIRTLTPEQRR